MNRNEPSPSAGLDEQRPQSYLFGPFELFPERQLLLKNGAQARIGGRALSLLLVLVRSAGQVVSKRALIAHAWPRVAVDEANLKVNMSALRRALGDDSDTAEYIATVAGRGYRFTAPVQLGGGRASPPPPSRPEQARSNNNLAVATTRILGRADAIESISADLSRWRLVSIIGPGGVGKTTVAIAIAERFLSRFRDGVWFVDLASIKDPKLLPNAMAIATGIVGQLPDSTDALQELLEGKEILLLLDNCEHIIDAVAECANRLLARNRGLKLLVTSREALMLSGERVRRLPSLDVPPVAAELDAAAALKHSAVQLFVERAMERCETFQLTDEAAPIVADICRKVDGLALAIELVAARVETFGIRGLQRQLNEHRLPAASRRAGPERHRTLTATIEWSYSLLPMSEARVLRAVSAFAGSFNAEGAAAVADISAAEATESLAQLAAKSLLSIDIDEDSIAYRLLETTRAFGLERLRQDSSFNSTVQRHARYILELLHRATSEWAQRPNRKLTSNYDRALANLYTTICTSTMVSQALMFTAMDAMRRAADIANDIGDAESQLRSLRVLGVNELLVGEPRSALRTFEKFSAVVTQHAPDVATESETYLGVTELFLGRLAASSQRLERLWERHFQQVPGALQTVLAAANEALTLFSYVLPHSRWLTGAPDSAVEIALATIAHTNGDGHIIFKNSALSYACPLLYWCGLYDECRRIAAELETHSEKYGFYPRRPVGTLYQAAIDCREGDSYHEAIATMQRSLEELRVANHFARMPYHLCLLAEALARHMRYEEAADVVDNALDLIRARGEEWCLPEVLRVRAAVLAGQGDNDAAEAALAVSMRKAKEMGALSWELRAANDLAALWIRQERFDEMRRMLDPLLGLFTEGHGTQDLRNAASLLRNASLDVAEMGTSGDSSQRRQQFLR